MEEKYIIVSGEDEKWGRWSNLGHEEFLTRKILMILLYNNLIENNCIIVTRFKDRSFLYTKYFKKVISYEEYVKENIKNIFLDLRPYLISTGFAENSFYEKLGAANGKTIQGLKLLGLESDYLTENKIFQNTNTPEFNNFICKLDFYPNLQQLSDITSFKFFVMHIRESYVHYKNLHCFIKYVEIKSGMKCAIFTNKKDKNYHNQITDLRIYASMLNHSNCKGLLGEWSGGTQLGQFCSKKIIYYFDAFPPSYKTEEIKEYEETNNKDFNLYWDHYNPIKCKKIFIDQKDLSLNKDNLIDFLLN